MMQPPHDDSQRTTDAVPGTPQATPTVDKWPPAADDALPVQAGRFQLLGEIARGGMGAVLKGRDPDLGRDLAVKVVLPKHRDQPEVVRRFLDEAQLAGQLQHPGVVPVYELGRLADGLPFFAMKLIEGRTLADLLRERPAPGHDLPRFLHHFEAVCQTVGYAHTRGIIHRDLKPLNVMVGAFGEVQVMDWGLAKRLAEPGTLATGVCVPPVANAAGSPAQTHAGAVIGTPAYMAPEQARGEGDRVDVRSDVFGLGAILCEILTGAPPFRGAGARDLLAQSAKGNLSSASARLDACGADGELVQLAKECLAPNRDERPANGAAVAERIEGYLAGVQERLREAEIDRAAAEARATEALAKAVAERRARRLLLGLSAAVLLLVLTGGAGAWMLQRQWDRQREAGDKALLTLERARELLERGWKDHDVARLKEAEAEAIRAMEIANSGEASADVRQEVTGFCNEARARRERAQENHDLLLALLDGSAPTETSSYANEPSGRVTALAQLSVDEKYTAAFQRWGLKLDDVPESDVVAQLREQPEVVLQEVIAGLDNLMLYRRRKNQPEARWRRVYRISQQLDGSEQRQLLRAMLIGESPLRKETIAAVRAEWNPARAPVQMALLLAHASNAAGDEAEVIQVLRRAIAVRPDQVALLDTLGQVLEEQGPAKVAEAIECYRAARAVRPRLGVALSRALRAGGRAGEAEIVLRELVEQQPNNPEMYVYLGNALYGQRRFAEAEVVQRQAVRLKPDFHVAHTNVGSALRAQGDLPGAIASFREAIRWKPDYPMAHLNLGSALADQGKLMEAIEAYREAVRFKPDYYGAYNNLGNALAAQQLPEAIDSYRKAIRIKPDFAMAHNNLGVGLKTQGKISEAINAYREAIRFKPDFAEAHINLGDALKAQGDLPGAIVALREAIRIKPDFAEAHLHLGVILADQGKLAEAIAAYRETIRLKPDVPDAHYDLGIALWGQGKLNAAILEFKEAIRLKPDYPEAHCNLGAALRFQGRFVDSLASYRRGHEVSSNSPDWRYPSGQWVRDAERLVKLDRQLPALLRGNYEPATAAEGLEFASFCQHRAKRMYAAAAQLAAAAFAAEPKHTADLNKQYRFTAARSAVLAAAGQAEDAKNLPDKVADGLRHQALQWLRADLALYAKLAERDEPTRKTVQQRLAHWQRDADLASIRHPWSLLRLPADERRQWQKLWDDVAALRQRAGDAK